MLHIMYEHPEFERNVTKYVPDNLQKNVRDTVDNLRNKVSTIHHQHKTPYTYSHNFNIIYVQYNLFED